MTMHGPKTQIFFCTAVCDWKRHVAQCRSNISIQNAIKTPKENWREATNYVADITVIL